MNGQVPVDHRPPLNPARDTTPVLIRCHRLDLDGPDSDSGPGPDLDPDPGRDPATLAVDLALLDPWEQRRAGALRFPRDRRRFIAAHAGLRRLLGSHLDLPPATLPLTRSSTGKPSLNLPGPPCHFSLTHSGGSGWLAIASVPVGIDAEVLIEPADLAALIAASCTVAETRMLDALDTARRAPAFLATWTRKEAALKAWGSGLGMIDPAHLEVGLDGPGDVSARGHEPLTVMTVTVGHGVLSVAAPRRPGFRLSLD